jgi:anthranilate/para-aminobenzoate synthase component I
MLPPGVDAIGAELDTFRAMAPEAELAPALARAAVGFIAYEATHTIHAIRRWDDELAAGCFLVGSTVVLFDHQAGRVTVAGPKAGRVAERCAWELRNGPRPAPAKVAGPDGVPAQLRSGLGEDQLAGRAARAQRFLLEPVTERRLAQSFSAPIGQADAFEIYRTLREPSQAATGFFVDFGVSPVSERLQLLGTAGPPMVLSRGGEPELGAELRACFPHREIVGHSSVDAARVVRRLEETSRELLGAMVGYFTPGGGGCFALAERPVAVRGEHAAVQVAVAVRLGADVTAADAEARRAVRAELAAIAAVQPA